MRRFSTALLGAAALGITLAAQAPAARPLDIYVVDTEGGKAALFVSPTGQSVLIDSGTLINLPEAVYGLERGPSESSYALTASSVRGCASHTAATCDVCTDLPSPAGKGPYG